MQGRRDFAAHEAAEIRRQLIVLRRSERDEQTRIRGRLRRQGFWISDWTDDGGFTATDLDALIRQGRITVDGSPVTATPYLSADTERRQPSGTRPEPPTSPAASAGLTVIVAALGAPGRTVDAMLAAHVPDARGLYAIHARRPGVWWAPGLGEAPDDRPLYVGKTQASLAARGVATHFQTGRTGGSSPRRSFAALLTGALDLTATPRRPERPEPTKWSHYALEPGGDERLTRWMLEHLRLAVWPQAGDAPLKDLEADVLRHWRPPLNLTGVRQPWMRQVRDAREAMATSAKVRTRDHGAVE